MSGASDRAARLILRSAWLIAASYLLLLLPAQLGWTAEAGTPPCRAAIAKAAGFANVPPDLLLAIGQIESGRPDPVTRRIEPWPWSVNVAGTSYFAASLEEAAGLVRSMQARNVRSIDVGCLQVNLLSHPDAFASVEQAFDPDANAQYAATFLRTLFERTGRWEDSTAAYHSLSPGVSASYRERVMRAWRGGNDAPAYGQGPAIRDFRSKAPASTMQRLVQDNRGAALRTRLGEFDSDHNALLLRAAGKGPLYFSASR